MIEATSDSRCSLGLSSSCVESFHSLVIRYRSKSNYFDKEGVLARGLLAALDYNHKLALSFLSLIKMPALF